MRERQIALPPFYSGPCRYEAIRKWNKENLYDLTHKEKAILLQAQTEARIRGNFSGGAPSGFSHSEKCRAINAINNGTAESLSFPATEQNEADIRARKLARM